MGHRRAIVEERKIEGELRWALFERDYRMVKPCEPKVAAAGQYLILRRIRRIYLNEGQFRTPMRIDSPRSSSRFRFLVLGGADMLVLYSWRRYFSMLLAGKVFRNALCRVCIEAIC